MNTTFQQAAQMLTGRCANSRKVGNNTYMERRGDDIAIKLHGTDVVTYHAGRQHFNQYRRLEHEYNPRPNSPMEPVSPARRPRKPRIPKRWPRPYLHWPRTF